MNSTVHIPYLNPVAYTTKEALLEALDLQGAHLAVDTVNWQSYPYCPLVSVRLAYWEGGLLLNYFVRGLDLRTLSLGDGHYVHTDSCVEFFMQRERGESYINFEFNAAGVCYACHHKTIKESTPLSPNEYASIKRTATHLDKKLDEAGMHSWEVSVEIPWTTMGYPEDVVPERLWGNFYKCGDDTAHPHFLSWAPIEEPAPAFHRPQFFGELVLLPKTI